MPDVAYEMPKTISIASLHVDLEGYRAELAGRSLKLSRSQFELLAILITNSRRVVSRQELAEALGLARGRSVDVLLSGLRREVGRDLVRNVRNRGWILEPGGLTS